MEVESRSLSALEEGEGHGDSGKRYGPGFIAGRCVAYVVDVVVDCLFVVMDSTAVATQLEEATNR